MVGFTCYCPTESSGFPAVFGTVAAILNDAGVHAVFYVYGVSVVFAPPVDIEVADVLVAVGFLHGVPAVILAFLLFMCSLL